MICHFVILCDILCHVCHDSLARERLTSKQLSLVTIRPPIEESLQVDPSIRSHPNI